MFLKPWTAVNQTACKMQPQETWTLPRSQTASKKLKNTPKMVLFSMILFMVLVNLNYVIYVLEMWRLDTVFFLLEIAKRKKKKYLYLNEWMMKPSVHQILT